MNRLKHKVARKAQRKARVRGKISGVLDRPRLNVFRSNKHIMIQLIDDVTGTTLCSASSLEKEHRPLRANKEGASKMGEIMGKRIQDIKVTKIVFDRNGYRYHGVIQSVADAVRKAGIEF